jgi:hypothetical protein
MVELPPPIGMANSLHNRDQILNKGSAINEKTSKASRRFFRELDRVFPGLDLVSDFGDIEPANDWLPLTKQRCGKFWPLWSFFEPHLRDDE